MAELNKQCHVLEQSKTSSTEGFQLPQCHGFKNQEHASLETSTGGPCCGLQSDSPLGGSLAFVTAGANEDLRPYTNTETRTS